jgi:tetratricopeptide (TPR) repeat protein
VLGFQSRNSYPRRVPRQPKVVPFPKPPEPADTWQVGFVRYPAWVEEDGEFFRPRVALAVSAETGRIGTSPLDRNGGDDVEAVKAAMDSLEEAAGTRPATIEVEEQGVADALAEVFAGRGIEVICREGLPLLAEPVRELYRKLAAEEPFDSATDVPGVTMDHLRGFAEAAEVFRRAAPWRHLDSSDVIELAQPRPGPNVRFASVLSAHGQLGLGFCDDRDLLEFGPDEGEQAVERLADRSLWSVTYCEPWEIPIAEWDGWIGSKLPIHPDGRIPAAIQYGPKRRIRRASSKMLAFFEGLFRALAETTEEELDSGAWSKTVDTALGALELNLSLPDILDPPPRDPNVQGRFNPLRHGMVMDDIRQLLEEQEFETGEEARAFIERELVGKKVPAPRGDGPEDEARELALEAMDTPGRLGIVLARRALDLDPNSTIALIALAERAPDNASAVERYRLAVEAAERELGPEIFERHVGDFWVLARTRSYMEARNGLADALWRSGARQDAVDHYVELLRLNPNDNQGIRFTLAPALMMTGADRAAEELLASYPEEITAAHAYNLALVAFRLEGDGKKARKRLAEALERNPHVADLLTGRAEFPDELPSAYQAGSRDEAVLYFVDAEEAWATTPGALEWLGAVHGEQ